MFGGSRRRDGSRAPVGEGGVKLTRLLASYISQWVIPEPLFAKFPLPHEEEKGLDGGVLGPAVFCCRKCEDLRLHLYQDSWNA